MPVPSLESVTIVITTDPTSQATITIIGANLTSTTHLMIDDKLIASDCTLRHNSCVFTLPRHGNDFTPCYCSRQYQMAPPIDNYDYIHGL